MTNSRLYHGDAVSLIPDHVEDDSVNVIITDPPYGVDAKSNFATTQAGMKHADKIMNDENISVALGLFHKLLDVVEPKLADECEMYVFTDWKILEPWIELIESTDVFTVKQLLIWEKGWPGLGDLATNWGKGYECIIYAKKGKRKVNFRRSAVLAFDKPTPGSQLHPHEKPVSLLRELMSVSASKGDLVLDPFCGSGSTLVAANDSGLNSIGFELDKKHFETANHRMLHPSILWGPQVNVVCC